jgi:ElaB/YqjD/DUF883 family membrane-anchored ribosome-binding protein
MMSAIVETHNAEPANSPLHHLFEEVEDLIKRVADSDNPDIQRIRAKAREALMAARSTLQSGADEAGSRLRSAARAATGYRHDGPWGAICFAVVTALGIAVLVRRNDRDLSYSDY